MKNIQNKKESRSVCFRRIAPKRTDYVLHYLHLLGNCSNKSGYDYTDDDVAKIFKAIDEQLRVTKARFKSGKNKKKFKL